MWGFLSAVFNKIALVATTVLVAAGLVSAPLPPVSEMPTTATSSQEAVQEIVLNQPEKEDKPAVSATAKTKAEKPKADDSETKKLEEKLAQTAQLLEALKKASPPPAPIPAPTSAPQYFTTPSGATLDKFGNVVNTTGNVGSSPTPSPAAPVPPGTFRLFNGALVDANGNIIQPAPSANISSQPVSSPTSPTPENFASGSTIQINRSALAAIEYNPNLDCESLGLYLSDIKKCKLYRTEKNNYNWAIVD